MEQFNVERLKRNPELLKKKVRTVDNTIRAEDDLFVMFPERFASVRLAEFKRSVSVISYYALIDAEGNYASIQAPIFQTLSPREVKDVEVKGVRYKLLIFKKGDVLVESRLLQKTEDVLYDIFQEFIMNAKVPWYMNYEELSNLIAGSKKYTGNAVGSDTTGLEVYVATISRDPKDLTTHIRHRFKSLADAKTAKIRYVGVSNVLGLDNTGARLIGGYWIDGLTGAIVQPEKTSSDLVNILRS